MRITLGTPNPTEFTIGHNVASKADVDAAMKQARTAGAVVVTPAHDTFWGGYAGYFQDPDGHLREVAWNPQWTIEGQRAFRVRDGKIAAKNSYRKNPPALAAARR